jgi:hypothetical protein
LLAENIVPKAGQALGSTLMPLGAKTHVRIIDVDSNCQIEAGGKKYG